MIVTVYLPFIKHTHASKINTTYNKNKNNQTVYYIYVNMVTGIPG